MRDLVGTTDKKNFLRGRFSKLVKKLNTQTELIRDTTPSYRINYPAERYNDNLIKPTNFFSEKNIQVMKKLSLFQ